MTTIAQVMLRHCLKQTVLYWQKTGDGQHGRPVHNPTPQVLPCRWEDKQIEVLLADGRKVLSKGFLMMVVPLTVGSWTMLGTLSSWQALPTYPKLPTVGQGGREVLVAELIPDWNDGSQMYQNYL
jgi:hypothetical protein